jgi:amino acid transporter
MTPLKQFLIGKPKDPNDPSVFHKLSLVAFLAWVGLGADGLSSSCYGPDEAFRALLGHEHLALFLALMMAVTVGVISFSYSLLIEHFPSGGGGYLVSTKLLGPRAGVVSGSALIVDYVLTITVSICAGVDAIFSFFPVGWQSYKLAAALTLLGFLLLLNLRGVKESIKVLLPIFLVFVATHIGLIVYGILSHGSSLPTIIHQAHTDTARDISIIGFIPMLMILLRAFSLGGGTYTGIEAVSNGLPILREPRVATGKRTMLYMALSLAFTAGGILVCYLLWSAVPEEGKTMNAVLLGRVFSSWHLGSWPVGAWLVIITLLSEGALLVVAAQTGFIDGPRVLANMALDSWMPHRFAQLSERLVTQNGVVIMAISSALLVIYTKGQTSFLVVLYSINVFLTFTLTQMGMSRFWVKERKNHRRWFRYLFVHGTGFALCLTILIIITFEKFKEGGWLTIVITTSLVALCFLIRRHYSSVAASVREADAILTNLPASQSAPGGEIDQGRPVAVLLVSGYGGLGIHSLLSVQKLFPSHFKDILFISLGVVDSGAFKGAGAVDELRQNTERNLARYVDFARGLGLNAGSRYSIGTEVVEQAYDLCLEVSRQYPHAVFFMGKIIFAKEKFFHKLLHNDTAHAIQRRLQFEGVQTVVLPIRITMG